MKRLDGIWGKRKRVLDMRFVQHISLSSISDICNLEDGTHSFTHIKLTKDQMSELTGWGHEPIDTIRGMKVVT